MEGKKRKKGKAWTQLPFAKLCLAPGESKVFEQMPQRELRPPYLFEIDCLMPHDVRVESITIGCELLAAAFASSALCAAVLRERELNGPCTKLGQPIRVVVRNDSCQTQEVNLTLLCDTIPIELRGLGCKQHEHRVSGCDACEERQRQADRYGNTARQARSLFQPPRMNDPMDFESDDLAGYYAPPMKRRDDSAEMLLRSAETMLQIAQRKQRGGWGALGIRYTRDAAGLRRAALDLIESDAADLSDTELHELQALMLYELNRRNERKGLAQVKIAPEASPQLFNINPLPPGGVVRTCLWLEIGQCGQCSLCVGKATLHVREEPPPSPPPPPPREVPPAKGPEFDSDGRLPVHDAPPAQPRLRAVDTIEFTSEHETATPTRAGLRLLAEQRHAALVADFEAWESATDEYP